MYGFRTVIAIARPFYAGDPIGVDLDQSLYALAFSWSILVHKTKRRFKQIKLRKPIEG